MTEPIPRPSATDPNFLLWREVDRLDRRIDAGERRMEQMDQTGTRGVAALQQQVAGLAADIREHETKHEEERREMARHRQWLIGIVVTVLLALVGPLYPILLVR